jgi:pilus assembly protein CpaE
MMITPEARPGGPVFLTAILRNQAAEAQLKSVASTIPNVRIETEVTDISRAQARFASLRSNTILLIDLDLGASSDISVLEATLREYGDKLAIIVTSANAAMQGVRQLMRVGVLDFLPQPITREDLVAALTTAAGRIKLKTGDAQLRRPVMTFIKASGGLGTTTLAVQTAHSLASRTVNGAKPKVCILDFDLQFGNAALYLDIDTHLNVFNIIDAPDRLDGSFLKGLMAHHESGIDLLAGPSFVVPLDAMTPDLAVRVIDTAAVEYDYVIVDIPQAWTHWSHAVLSHSDLVVLVTQLTVPALRQGRRLLDTIRQEGLENLPKLTVVNRFERSIFNRDIRVKEAEKALGAVFDAYVDNDYKTISDALNQGVPLTQVGGGSKLQKQIDVLADSCVAKLKAAATAKMLV